MLIISAVSELFGPVADIPNGLVNVFGSEFQAPVTIVMGILAFLTLIGGFGIIVGGIVLTRQNFTAGQLLILIALGMAILGLVMTLVQHFLAGIFLMALTLQVSQSIGWIGAILTLVARIIAEQPRLIE